LSKRKTEPAPEQEPARANAVVPASLPDPSPRMAAAIAEAEERVKARRPRMRMKTEHKDGRLLLSAPHSDGQGFASMHLDAFGTRSSDFANKMAERLFNGVRRARAEHPTEQEVNAALAAVDGLRPRDELEAMLAVQMVITHEAAVDMLNRARHNEYTATVSAYGNLAVKFLRTYTAQLEALAKLRRGGEQTVRVEHVHVHSGGQAIVGAVTAAGPAGGGVAEK
jgi:hypothetical protein